ncbi:hypothetical protein [Amycolatopsis antarctica]|uniref:hypothetical protein n=1 Tax=Amycolatopsis antarctica TaxID=1854586 RepID=UPI0013FD6F94|nr:hypothetical protein [Amycolatopsis antarctica]
MPKHSACAAVRLVDRCVQCNPGYSDPSQAYRIWQDAKRYGLAAAERIEQQKKRR